MSCSFWFTSFLRKEYYWHRISLLVWRSFSERRIWATRLHRGTTHAKKCGTTRKHKISHNLAAFVFYSCVCRYLQRVKNYNCYRNNLTVLFCAYYGSEKWPFKWIGPRACNLYLPHSSIPNIQHGSSSLSFWDGLAKWSAGEKRILRDHFHEFRICSGI